MRVLDTAYHNMTTPEPNSYIFGQFVQIVCYFLEFCYFLFDSFISVVSISDAYNEI